MVTQNIVKDTDMRTIPDLGMYSDKGNKIAWSIVEHAKDYNWTWPQTFAVLQATAKSGVYEAEEIMDTVVRERIYRALGYTSDFYFPLEVDKW
jgi:hypothetical protein